MEKMSRKKSNAAFVKELYLLEYRHIYSVIKGCSMTRKKIDYEDIMHDVFLCALENADELRSHNNAVGWLVRTAIHKTYDYNRRSAHEVVSDLSEETVSGPEDEIFNQMESEYMSDNERMVQILEQLTASEMRLYALRYREQRSYDEIAEVMKITKKNVSVRLVRLNRKLHDLIDDMFKAENA